MITCLLAFSNVAPDLRGTMLRTWTDFLAPQGRIVFEMHHPTHDLASYDVENESGMSVFRWKMLDQHSLATCAAAPPVPPPARLSEKRPACSWWESWSSSEWRDTKTSSLRLKRAAQPNIDTSEEGGGFEN